MLAWGTQGPLKFFRRDVLVGGLFLAAMVVWGVSFQPRTALWVGVLCAAIVVWLGVFHRRAMLWVAAVGAVIALWLAVFRGHQIVEWWQAPPAPQVAQVSVPAPAVKPPAPQVTTPAPQPPTFSGPLTPAPSTSKEPELVAKATDEDDFGKLTVQLDATKKRVADLERRLAACPCGKHAKPQPHRPEKKPAAIHRPVPAKVTAVPLPPLVPKEAPVALAPTPSRPEVVRALTDQIGMAPARPLLPQAVVEFRKGTPDGPLVAHLRADVHMYGVGGGEMRSFALVAGANGRTNTFDVDPSISYIDVVGSTELAYLRPQVGSILRVRRSELDPSRGVALVTFVIR